MPHPHDVLRRLLPTAALLWMTAGSLAACTSGPVGGSAARAPAPAAGPMAGRDGSRRAHREAGDSSGPVEDSITRACMARLPDSMLTRRDTVYLHAVILDVAARGLLPQADLLAQRVALQLLELLGGRSDSLPTGEPRVAWYDGLGGNVALMAHRDGRATWHELAVSDPDTAALRAVERAVALADSGGPLVTWAAAAGQDSVALRLALDLDDQAGYKRGVGLGFPVFSRRAPPMTRPQVTGHPSLQYPPGLRERRVDGRVVMQAIIDATGHVEPGSVRDLWPENTPRLAGRREADYRAFVASAREVVLGSQYAPGRIGTCAVRVRVQIPFNFQVAGN